LHELTRRLATETFNAWLLMKNSNYCNPSQYTLHGD